MFDRIVNTFSSRAQPSAVHAPVDAGAGPDTLEYRRESSMAQERRYVARKVRGRFEAGSVRTVRTTFPVDGPGLHGDLASHGDDAQQGHACPGGSVLPDLERDAPNSWPSRDGRAAAKLAGTRRRPPPGGWRVPPSGGQPPHAKSGPTSQWCRRWGCTPTAAHRNVRLATTPSRSFFIFGLGTHSLSAHWTIVRRNSKHVSPALTG